MVTLDRGSIFFQGPVVRRDHKCLGVAAWMDGGSGDTDGDQSLRNQVHRHRVLHFILEQLKLSIDVDHE